MLVLVSYFSNLKWIIYIFRLILFFFNFHKIESHIWNNPGAKFNWFQRLDDYHYLVLGLRMKIRLLMTMEGGKLNFSLLLSVYGDTF